MPPRTRIVLTSTAIGLVTVLPAGCGNPRTTPDVDVTAPRAPLTVEADGWSDVDVASVCLTVDATGDLEPARTGALPHQYVVALIEALSVDVVASDCDAELAIDLRAELIGASYGPFCYEGFDHAATARLTAAGTPDLTASFELYRDPPDTILETACTVDPQVPSAMWQGILTGDDKDRPGVLIQLLGDRARLARDITSDMHELGSRDFAGTAEGDPLAPWVLDTMAAALHSQERALRASTADAIDRLAGDLWRRSDEFLPLVPHLIWALAAEDAAEIETLGEMDDGKGDIPYVRARLGMALEEITNEEIPYRADLWWEWWQDQ